MKTKSENEHRKEKKVQKREEISPKKENTLREIENVLHSQNKNRKFSKRNI